MNQEEIQQKLNSFYKEKLKEYENIFHDKHLKELSLPFLLSATDDYIKSPYKIMFIGKETNGWIGKLGRYYEGKTKIEDLLENYNKHINNPVGKSAFPLMHQKAADKFSHGNRKSIAWNNLCKMDWAQGRTDSRNSLHHSKELKIFSQDLVRFEVELLKPNAIIFASGPNYDSAIKSTFRNIEKSQVLVPRAFWQFFIGDILCLRLHHPQSRTKINNLGVSDFYNQAFDLLHKHKSTQS